jgi:molybdate transport system substrate-binding protein
MIRWLFALFLLTSPAAAGEVTVLSAGAINGVAAAMKPVFEREAGDTVTLRNDTAGALVKRIQAGEAFDVVLLSQAGLDSLGDKVAPGTRVTLASVGVGVGVREGAAPPDIATVEAFRATMLRARAVAYIDPASGGTSGIYIARLFQSLGIAEAMAPKSVLVQGGLAATAVTDGRADVVLQQASEIRAVPGVTLAGPLPDAIQMRTVYAGGLAAGSKDNAAAAAFLRAMSGPDARAAMATHGLTAP